MEGAVTTSGPIQPTVGEEIDGPGRQYFEDPVIDNLMDALLELSAEVWTTRDRLTILEHVLATKNIDAAELIESYQPSAEERAGLNQARTAFVSRVFAGFARRGGPQPGRHQNEEES